jgi:hypothetical protein
VDTVRVHAVRLGGFPPGRDADIVEGTLDLAQAVRARILHVNHLAVLQARGVLDQGEMHDAAHIRQRTHERERQR